MPIATGNEPTGDPAVQGHETILQQLNRKIGDDFFPVESFENVTDWDTVPVIFAQDHPDMDAYDADPAAELARIAETTGRRADVVGTPTNARIETTGRPRLQADLNWNADPDVQRLFDEGKLGVSTGFWANSTDNRLTGQIKPHHILLFEEDQMNQPRDKGAVVLNKERNMKAFTNEGRVLSGKNPSRLNEIFDMLKSFIEEISGGSAPVTNQEPSEIVQTYTEKSEEITNMADEIVASKDAEITDLKAQLQKEQDEKKILADKMAEIETAQKEAAWQALKNKLPPGMVHTPEIEQETRALFETDPTAFTNKLLEIRVAGDKTETGQPFTNQEEDPVAKRNEILGRRAAIPGTLH